MTTRRKSLLFLQDLPIHVTVVHLFHKPDSCCHFLVDSIIVWYLAEPESRPASGDDVEEMLLKDGTDTSGKLAKDKIHVEELRLPEIMIPMTKTKGSN